MLKRVLAGGCQLTARMPFTCLLAGKGVTIYTVDSGIRTSHQEFQPWGGGTSRARAGPDFVDDDDLADDCDGHGRYTPVD